MRLAQTRSATDVSPPFTNTQRPNSKLPLMKPRARASTLRFMPRVNPVRSYAAQAGVVSIDHANQLSDETMRIMREKQIFAVPTFTIFEYFSEHAQSPEQGARDRQMLDLHAIEFRKQLAAGVPMAVGSDVGPFPHGTQARELELMVKYGMSSNRRTASRSA